MYFDLNIYIVFFYSIENKIIITSFKMVWNLDRQEKSLINFVPGRSIENDWNRSVNEETCMSRNSYAYKSTPIKRVPLSNCASVYIYIYNLFDF